MNAPRWMGFTEAMQAVMAIGHVTLLVAVQMIYGAVETTAQTMQPLAENFRVPLETLILTDGIT